jgi:predicted ArsR family transcriptional regulator
VNETTLPNSIDGAIERLLPLMEPARRRIFAYVSGAAMPVSREEAAAATGLSTALAAFHLEKLLEAGLVESSFEGPASGGPRRRGRPAKLYRSSRTDISLSLPARNYRLAAEIFAEAMPVESAGSVLEEAARRRGRSIGAPGAGASTGEGGPAGIEHLVATLTEAGYRPRRIDGRIELGNCPFEALTEGHVELICPANRALLEGILEGAGVSNMEARLEPGDGRCCVVIAPTES